MAEKIAKNKKPASPDWFVQGVLTKIGDTFDRLTGRGWKPSSSLATSELAERLKSLVDSEVREVSGTRKYVPHNIKLKMQWDKFSTDSETALKKLEHELLTGLIDHINDRRYYTYGPISLVVTPDYFINGVKLFASFDETDRDENEASINVTVPSLRIDLPPETTAPVTPHGMSVILRFNASGKEFEKPLEMESGKRFSVGRTNQSDVAIDDTSVSKMHASLLLNSGGELVVADTGSTNGTFVDGERIAYGKAFVFAPTQKLRFGTIEVGVEIIERRQPTEPVLAETKAAADDVYKVGEFEFTRKADEVGTPAVPAPTVPSIPMPDLAVLNPLNVESVPDQADKDNNQRK